MGSLSKPLPKFSVVIPTCHRNDLLSKCLDCLDPRMQTLSVDEYEVIVTDDGSVSTAEQMIQENYPWVKWVAGPCKGPAANRNNGARVAQGEWLVFTDDDCLPDAQWLQSFKAEITLDIDVYEGKTTCKEGLHSPLEHAPINLIGACLWSCNMMIKKEVFESLNGFDENFPYPHMEDVDLRERINNKEKPMKFIDSAVVDHPSKRLPSGHRLAKTHESQFYFYDKYSVVVHIHDFLFLIVRARTKSILSYPVCLDSWIALYSMLIELCATVPLIVRWKMRNTFRGF